MTFLRKLIFRMLGVPDLKERVLDLERHFVTRRSVEGKPVETLADVPYAKRKELKHATKGMNLMQRRAYYEAREAKPDGTVPLRMDA